VRTSVRPGTRRRVIVFDRDKTLAVRSRPAAVSNLVRDQVLGNVSTRFNDGDEKIDVRVLGDEVRSATPRARARPRGQPRRPTPVPLRSVAEVARAGPGGDPAHRQHARGRRHAAPAGSTSAASTARSRRQLATLDVPDDVVSSSAARSARWTTAQQNMIFALRWRCSSSTS
jgi:multidrug efflux pump subunit AcrB